MRLKCLSISLYEETFSRYKKCWKAPNDLIPTLKQKYLIYTKNLPSRYMVVEKWNIQKCSQWPQNDVKHLTFQSVVSTLSTPRPLAQSSVRCTLWPQTDSKHLTVKRTLHTPSPCPWNSNFGPFRSTDHLFQHTEHFILPHWQPC